MSRRHDAAAPPWDAGLESPQAIVRRRFGLLTHDHQAAAFERSLERLTRSLGYASREEYLDALSRLESDEPEVQELVDAITVGESYFFRDASQLEFLEKHWIPGLVARGREGRRTVRVWSAGCSQGQEIYTIAMLLEHHLPDAGRWDLRLVATDINREALQAAGEGRFRDWSLRATPEWARTRFFQRDAGQWRLAPGIRSLPRFERINLADTRTPWRPGGETSFDLILCRNVFIYFERDAVRAALARFVQCLDPAGVLLLGPADIVSEDCPGLEPVQWGRCQYYRHAAPAPALAMPARAPQPRPAGARKPPRRPAAGTPHDREAAARRPASREVEREAVEELLRIGAWEAAATAAEAWLSRYGEDVPMLERSAQAKACLGRLEEARAAVDRALAMDSLHAGAHFTLGLVLMEGDESQAAESALRRAVYIDSAFLEAHYHLGALLLRQGRRDAGLKSLRNALAIVERANPGTPLTMAPDLTCGELAEILGRELAVHGGAVEGARA